MSSQISSTSYWQKAYDSLSPELQANFQHAKTSKRDILEAVLKTAEEKREICLRKRWKLTLPKGQVIIVRDVIEKITGWIQNFIAVGDVAIQYNTSSVALPWAAIRFLLQATINDTQVESSVVSDLETISRLVARYHEFERIHLQRNSTLKPRIEECLTRLYADILSFLGQAVGYFGNKTIGRVARNAFGVPNVSHSRKILEQEAELLKVAGLSDSEKLYYLENSITRLVDRTMVYDQVIEEAEHLKLVQWLSKVPVSSHHTLRSEERMPDSAKWLLIHDEYKNWKYSSSSATLLLHGIAGSGKSIICSAVIDYCLNEQATSCQVARLAYFYCADCKFEPERSEPAEILRSILKQLVIDQTRQHVVPDFIRSEFSRRVAHSNIDGMDVEKLSIKDCVKFIQQVTEDYPVTIIIDALDEIEEFGRPSLVEALKQIIADSLNVVKVFVTTRNDSHIFALFSDDLEHPTAKSPTQWNGNVTKIRISREDTLTDMEAYVNLQLSIMKNGRHLLKGKISSRLSQVLAEKLVDGAGEMFQWVTIQLRHLCNQDREEDIIEILDNGKFAALDDIYAAILDSILNKGGVSCDIAIRTFSWLLFMQESVSSQSLLSIVSTQILSTDAEFQSSQLMDICSNLVLLDEKRDTFRFSHHSVQEYLRKHERLNSDAANLLIGNKCLEVCIEGPSADDEEENQSSSAVYRYAAMYWPYHTSSVLEKQEQDEVLAKVLSFVYDGPNDASLSFMTWMDEVEGIARTLSNDHPLKVAQDAIPNPNYSPLFVASIFGLMGLIEAIAETSDDQVWDQVNHYGHTSLYLSCANGHASIAKALILYGADPSVRCGRFGNCLQAACFNGHTAVVSVLLTQGTPIHQPGTFSSALEAAFRGQQEEIVLLLLQQSSAIRNHEDYLEALGGAALSGFLRVLEQLETSPLASIYNTTADKVKFKTAKAIRGGQQGVLTRILKNAPDPAAILPQEAVALATVYGHDTIVKLLADIGISLQGGHNLGSPVRCASLMNRESTVRLLITLGADVNILDSYGTALQAASMKGHKRIVKLLLAEGAEVNQQGGVYGTALQAAAYHGHRDIVDLLLESNASMGISGLSKDAFHAAVEGGQQHIVQHMLDKRLLDKHSEINFPSLQPMYRKVPESKYQKLLRNSSRSRRFPDKKSKKHPSSRSVLNDAADDQPETDSEDITAAMGEMGMGSSSSHSLKSLTPTPCQNQRIQTSDRSKDPLTICVEIGNTLAVSSTLQRKGMLGLQHKDIVRTLKVAASKGYIAVMHLLLEHIPMPISMADGFEALKQAVSNCHLEGTNLLLKYIDSSGWESQSLQGLITQACQANVSVLKAVLSFARTFMPIEDVDLMLETAFPHAADQGEDEGKADVIDWIYKEIGTHNQSYCRDLFKVACNRSLQRTAAQILQIAGKQGIDKNDVLEAITIWASNGCVELLTYLNEFLISEGEEVSYVEVLRAACKEGHLPVIDWALKQPYQLADITLGLVIASSNGHVRIVQALLEAGADVNAAVTVSSIDLNENLARLLDNERDEVIIALHAALRRIASSKSDHPFAETVCVDDYENVIRVLLDHGADVNIMGLYSIFPLFVAVHRGSQRLVRWLIDAGANVNAMIDARNAVMVAATREESSFNIMQILLDSGAQISSDTDYLSRLFQVILQYFDIDDDRSRHDDCSEGRFVYTESLSDVFTTGPGAVLRFLLENTSWRKPYPHFSLILQMVCTLGDDGYVDLLLERGVDVNAVCSYYGTALQAAARQGHKSLVQKLLKAGADPNITGGAHSTALQAAVKGGYSGIVRMLLSSGANVRPPLLNLAAEMCDEEIMSILLNSGMDESQNAPERQSALILACARGDIKIVQRLLAAGACPDVVVVRNSWGINSSSSPEMTALHMCCYHGNEEVMQLLLEKEPNLEVQIKYSETPLVVAAKRGFSGIIRILIAAGANIKHKGSSFGTPLSAAAKNGQLEAVKTLLAAGAPVYDPERGINHLISSDSLPVLELLAEAVAALPDGQLAIIAAMQNWCKWVISNRLNLLSEAHIRLISDYVGPTTEGLLAGCILGSASIVETMLDNGISADEGTISGLGALRIAARYLHPDVVQILLDHGANLHDQSPQTGSILDAAMLGCVKDCLPQKANPEDKNDAPLAHFYHTYWGSDKESNCERIVKLLIERGIEITNTAFLFGTSLHLACFMGNESIITALLEKGSDVNSDAGYFKNPLFAAIFRNNEKSVELLLINGADPNSCHPKFGSALSYAFEKGGVRIIELLLHRGADPNVKGVLEHSLIAEIMADGSRFRHARLSEPYRTQLVTQILNLGQPLKICDSDLVAVANSKFSIDGKSAAQILLERNTEMIVSEETIISLLKLDSYLWHSTRHCVELKLFLRRSGDKGVTKAMLQQAQSLDQMNILLAHEPRCPITPEIVETQNSIELMALLLEFEPSIVSTQGMVTQLLNNRERHTTFDEEVIVNVLQELWRRNSGLQVTEAMFENIMSSGPKTLHFLLSHSPPDLQLSQGVFIAAGTDGFYPLELLRLLVEHKPNLQIEEETVAKILQNSRGVKKLDFFLENKPDMLISERIFLAVLQPYKRLLILSRSNEQPLKAMKEIGGVLKRHGKTVEITDAIRQMIDEFFSGSGEPADKELFYSQITA
ncbi:ankyrin repeat-containing domain protein [Xylaria cf. heliscus]|nr:ankyrin repeat-containing domain protein [Xylaria cf. heliscus]